MTTARHLQTIARSTYLSVALALITATSLPLLSAATASAECIPPESTAAGVHRPVGSDAAAYTYNCDTGMWESAHFIFNPNTSAYTPLDAPIYTYNAGTGGYDTTTYVWNAPQGSYMAVSQNVATPPAGATVHGAPPAPTPTGNSISNTGAGSTNTINNNGGSTNGSSIGNTGTNSNNSINGNANTTTNANNNTSANMNNTITANANTGNALVIGNTSAGGAQSGNAQDIANVVNMLQSSSNALDGNTVTFVANIDGDVNGDLLFDPAKIGNVQPAGTTGPSVGDNNLTLNNQLDANITNNINLTANSGDAIVAQNTNAGDATTGSATTIANVVNLINSAVTSGKSFLGTININGNLNGDILVPDNFVDQLIDANTPTVTITNTGAGSNNAINTTDSDNTTIKNTNNLGITNNVDANAASGAANVSQNTKAGGAKSGSATTSITAFNLTGSQVVGKNAMLVFVNVLGSWVGLIVNAPAGATAAALGGNTTSNKTGNTNTNINNLANHTITNNITTNANSGDATVAQNTNGGSATSGDAHGAVNLANVENSSLALSDWFGILFINVFGTWHGSFGVNTSAGDPIATGSASPAGTQTGASSFAAASTAAAGAGFASFIPRGNTPNATPAGGVAAANAAGTSAGPSVTTAGTVLAANTIKGSQAPTPALSGKPSDFSTKAVIIALITVAIIAGDALYTRRKQHA